MPEEAGGNEFREEQQLSAAEEFASPFHSLVPSERHSEPVPESDDGSIAEGPIVPAQMAL